VLEPDISGLEPVPGLNSGGRLVASRLIEGGATFGIIMTSAEDGPSSRYVTLKDIYAAIDGVVAQIRKDKAPHPLLVIYVAGHGVADGVGWNHFLFPGDFVYRGHPTSESLDQLAARSLHAATLVDRLNKLNLHYLVMLDSCYEGTVGKFETGILSSQAASGLNDVMNALRWINEFHQSDPVLFAAPPGTLTQTVADPTDSQPNLIGPLARRFLLAFDVTQIDGLPLGNLVDAMKSRNLDPATQPTFTQAQPGQEWQRSVSIRNRTVGKGIERLGTAEKACDPCCVK
jgi:hypothetical protein